ncbi:MAG: hypothetical protein GX639_16565, partial [Fibrobacter sp.]|nr:hypothetical protein [Fibrobacter sp.]
FYTWKRNGVDISDGSNYRGVKKETLEVLVNSSTAGSFTCVVDNGAGCSVSSEAVALSIKPASLIIHSQPSSQILSSDAIAPIDVRVTGGSGDYSYQWYFNGAPFNANYPSCSSGTGTSNLDYIFGTDCSNGEYYCVISDNDGVTCPITTTPFTITTSGPCD